MMRLRHEYTIPSGLGSNYYAVVPGDLATIYNFNPVFNAGISGQGQTIVLIENTDLYSTADWGTFRSTFGLSGYSAGSLTQTNPAPPSGPNNCIDPGVNADDGEAILDAEYASAAAPNAAIQMAACADAQLTFGGLIAIQNLINSTSTPPAIISISYGECETVNGAAANAAFNSAYQQAAAEGVSVFVAAGDSGAATCDQNQAAAANGITVSALASTPYNVAVGGTDFGDTYAGTNSTYWNSGNSATYASALSYVPEIPWNDSCAGALLTTYENYPSSGPNSLCNYAGGLISAILGTTTTAAGGGGPSGCATGTPSIGGVVSGTCAGYPKPSWQVVAGNPNDGVRDLPDVSLFSANGLWSHFYVFCYSDIANGGTACSGAPSGWTAAGGTSFASPIMAGVQALINQRSGARQGNPNPVYYSLAAAQFSGGGNASCNSSLGNGTASSCVFYDVTQGDMAVDCTGSANCFDSADGYGVLSTSNSVKQPAYGTTTLWDFATGIGTINVTNLVNSWPGSAAAPDFSLSASPTSVTIIQGGSGAGTTITINPVNGFGGSVSLVITSALPSGVTISFNPDPTNGSSTLTFTAGPSATMGSVMVTVTGTSGSLTHTTSINLTVNASAPAPDFSLSASPSSLSVGRGKSGTSTITVNKLSSFSSSVSLSASGLPKGATASFNPSITAGASTLTLKVSNAAAIGTSTITVKGVSGSLSHTTALTLTVTRR
jgi:subtilase family serine protease